MWAIRGPLTLYWTYQVQGAPHIFFSLIQSAVVLDWNAHIRSLPRMKWRSASGLFEEIKTLNEEKWRRKWSYNSPHLNEQDAKMRNLSNRRKLQLARLKNVDEEQSRKSHIHAYTLEETEELSNNKIIIKTKIRTNELSRLRNCSQKQQKGWLITQTA